MRRTRTRYAPSWQRTALRILCVILAVILAAMILATIYIESLFGKLNRKDSSNGLSSLSDAVSDYIPSHGNVIDSEGTINIMLVGTDLSEARSDTMILCTVNKSSKTITLTSFLRDTYVEIPDYFPHKLNTAHALDGFTALNNTLAENFGVQVDGNISVNFESFAQVVDTIGGIDVELTWEEADHLNGLLGWDLTEGLNRLSGDQALNYARIRALDSDMGRANRQRTVITAILQEVKSLSLFELNDLLNEILPMVHTNLSNSEIVNYALECLPVLAGVSIQTQQIPAEGTYHLDWVEQDGGMSVIWVDDFDANRAILEDIMSD